MPKWNKTKQKKNPTVCGNYLALMEQCRVNAFNLVPFQLISLALHVLHDGINSSLCRWTEDSLPFPCSKGSKAVGALSHGWKTRREESSFFSDKHGKLSNSALHKLLRHEEKCRTAEAVSVTQIHSGHGLLEQHPVGFGGTACEWKGAMEQAMAEEADAVLLSAISLFHKLQQRLYNLLSA